MENGDRMKFFEMIRKTTIVQRILIGGSIVWILWEPRGLVDFVEGLILIVVVWGLYWIIIEIMRKRKKELEDTENQITNKFYFGNVSTKTARIVSLHFPSL